MNLPNKITMFRIVLIPVFLVVLLTNCFGEYSHYVSFVIFAVASASDALDGYIARKYNLVTNFGKLMDPLADKLLVNSALIAFIELSKLPSWFVILVVAREFIVTGFRMIAVEKNVVIAAGQTGKLKTIFQMILILFILLELNGQMFDYITLALIAITTFFTVVSAFSYIKDNVNVIRG